VIADSIVARYQAGERIAEIARNLDIAPKIVSRVLREAGELTAERVRAVYKQIGTYKGAAAILGISYSTVKEVVDGAWDEPEDVGPKCARCEILLSKCGPARDENRRPTNDPPHHDGICWACWRELRYEQEHCTEIAALRGALAMEEVS